jgi:hypothetical protein
LKQSRPFIKEAGKSVLNPGIKPKSLPFNTITTPRTPGKGKPMIRQVKPVEKEKASVLPGGPTGRTERQQVKPVKKGKAPVLQGGPTGRAEKQQIKPAVKKPVAGREKKDMKMPAGLTESPQEDNKKQGEVAPER